jgi:hypothetical protein
VIAKSLGKAAATSQTPAKLKLAAWCTDAALLK